MAGYLGLDECWGWEGVDRGKLVGGHSQCLVSEKTAFRAPQETKDLHEVRPNYYLTRGPVAAEMLAISGLKSLGSEPTI